MGYDKYIFSIVGFDSTMVIQMFLIEFSI